jgi:hypothetical protein
MASSWLNRMFVWHRGPGFAGTGVLIAFLLVAGYLAHFCPNTFELSHNWSTSSTVALALLFLTCLVMILGGKASPFLYFQF